MNKAVFMKLGCVYVWAVAVLCIATDSTDANPTNSPAEAESRRIAKEVVAGVKGPQFSPAMQVVYDHFRHSGCDIEESSQATGGEIDAANFAETISLAGNLEGKHFDILIAKARDAGSLQRVQKELSKQGASLRTNGLFLLTFNDDDEAPMTSSTKQQIMDIFKSFQSPVKPPPSTQGK